VSKRIMLVGEAWGRYEVEQGRPFVGPSGGLLNAFLTSAGLSRNDCYLTNVFNFQPRGNKLSNICGPRDLGIPRMPPLEKGRYVSNEYAHELKRLYEEVRAVNPNIIVPLGNTACWALLHNPGIKKLRGAPIATITGHKAIPTYHPAAVLREYKLRPIVFSDFKKIERQSHFPEIVRPSREFWLRPTLEDLHEFEQYILEADILSVDIETWNMQITCIGFATSRGRAIVVPFVWHGSKDCNYWPTLELELEVWSIMRRWLTSGKRIIGQNFLYDARYLWHRYGIPVQDIFADTMLTHHAQQPEMEKSLGFLGSIYTEEPSWKFMRKDIKTLKKED
jgi:uracil-DNA glycosylase